MGGMHVVTTRRRYKDKVYECHLVRRSFREGSKMRKETLANITALPEPVIELVRRALRGEPFVGLQDAFQIERSVPHGHVAAVAVQVYPGGPTPLIPRPCRSR